MIPRTKPHIYEDVIKDILNDKSVPDINYCDELFYFNSGSAALYFFLKLFEKELYVGVQVFTCSTVLNAIKNAGCKPIFMDVDIDYFTSLSEQVKTIIDKVDVLILTHLFGIPNVDYLEIKELCNRRGVIIIDDLTQTYKAKINNVYLEDISENYIYSFFYDKPISGGYSGGALKVMTSLQNKAHKNFNMIKSLSERCGKKQLRSLFWMNRLLVPHLYKKDFRTGGIYEQVILANVPISTPLWCIKLLLSNYLIQLFNIIIFRTNKAICAKMPLNQKKYVQFAMSKYKNNNDIFQTICVNKDILIPEFFIDNRITPSISKRSIINKKYMDRFEDIEIGLYNWPLLLSNKDNYPNANYIVNNYINIPTWINLDNL